MELKNYKRIPLPKDASTACEGCVAETDDDLCEILVCKQGMIYKRTYTRKEWRNGSIKD